MINIKMIKPLRNFNPIKSLLLLLLAVVSVNALALQEIGDTELAAVSAQGVHVSYFETEYSGCTLAFRGAFAQKKYTQSRCDVAGLNSAAAASNDIYTSRDGGYDRVFNGLNYGAKIDAPTAQARINTYSADGKKDWQSYRLSMDAVIKISGSIRRARMGGYKMDDGIDNDKDLVDSQYNMGGDPFTDVSGWDMDAENIQMGFTTCSFLYQAYATREAGGLCNGRAGQEFLPHQYYDDELYTKNSYNIYGDRIPGHRGGPGPNENGDPVGVHNDNDMVTGGLLNDISRSDPGDLRPYDPVVIANPFMELMFAPECELFGEICNPGVNDQSVFAGMRFGAEEMSGTLGVSGNWISGYVNAALGANLYSRCYGIGNFNTMASLGPIALPEITSNLDSVMCGDAGLQGIGAAINLGDGSREDDTKGTSFNLLLKGMLTEELGRGLTIWGTRRITPDSIDMDVAIPKIIDNLLMGIIGAIGIDLSGAVKIVTKPKEVLKAGASILPPAGELLSTVHVQETHGMWLSLVREDMQWPGQGWEACDTYNVWQGCRDTSIGGSANEISNATEVQSSASDPNGYLRTSTNHDFKGWNVHAAGRAWGHGGMKISLDINDLIGAADITAIEIVTLDFGGGGTAVVTAML